MPQRESFVAQLPEAERYRLLIDAVTDYAIYLLDADGLVVSWNPGAQRAKGYSEAEILGRHFSCFYTEEDRRAGLPQRALDAAARLGRFESEGWRVHRDGQRFWCHVIIDPVFSPAGEVVGYAKVTRDLSERRKAEEHLRRTEEQFRLLVQSVTDYAIFMLDEHGVISSWNAGAERINGHTAAEVVGTPFSRFYPPGDQAGGMPARALETATREGRFEGEGWRMRKDGSTFWANVVIDPIRGADGRLVGFAKVTRDMTEKRKAQQALELAREKLFEAQKIEALGRLTGGVAHDFNNLLMVVLSSLELLRRSVPQEARTARLIDNAMKAAQRGAALTQRMLAFARRQELVPHRLDLATLVQGITALLTQSVGPRVHLVMALPAGLPPVLADANQLELALLNLAVNANDAMPDGGTLTIAAAAEAVSEGHAHLRTGGYVRLSVTDTGRGMDAATLARATEPFFTTKGLSKGTGLGLAMVQGLAAQSGGHLALDSAVGQGTTATMWLPVAGDDAAADGPLPAASAADAAPPPARTVLVVDDDELVLASTSAMVEELGHQVLRASSAAEALDVLRRHPAVGLVIADYAMPDTSGAELLAAVRERHGAALPTILATGYAELDRPIADAVHLRKPFDVTALARAIAAAVTAQPAPR